MHIVLLRCNGDAVLAIVPSLLVVAEVIKFLRRRRTASPDLVPSLSPAQSLAN